MWMGRYYEQKYRSKLLFSNFFVANYHILCRKCFKCVPLGVPISPVYTICRRSVLCFEKQLRGRLFLYYVYCSGVENHLVDNFVDHFPQDAGFLANSPRQSPNSSRVGNVLANSSAVWWPTYGDECSKRERFHVGSFNWSQQNLLVLSLDDSLALFWDVRWDSGWIDSLLSFKKFWQYYSSLSRRISAIQ